MIHSGARYGLIAALLVTAACQEEPVATALDATSPGAAAALAATGRPDGAGRGNPVGRVLALRAELDLTPEQVDRLTAIGERLESANAPLREQVKAMVGERVRGERPTAEERAARRERMEQARPLLQQIRENSRAALQEVREVLTDAQETALRERAQRRAREGARGARSVGGGDPIARLLQRGTELGLTQEQVAGLTAIQARLEERNAPLREQVRGILGEPARRDGLTAEERAARREKMEQARPLLQQIRENSRAALQEVREVLTDAQEAALRERGGRGSRGGGPRQGG